MTVVIFEEHIAEVWFSEKGNSKMSSIGSLCKLGTYNEKQYLI